MTLGLRSSIRIEQICQFASAKRHESRAAIHRIRNLHSLLPTNLSAGGETKAKRSADDPKMSKSRSNSSGCSPPTLSANIQCGICKNVMPAAKFLAHKERKHPLTEFVKYVKLPAIERDNGPAAVSYVKCRYCPNRVPATSLDKHMQKCHAACHLCGHVISKTGYDRHMRDKHNLAALKAGASSTVGGSMPNMAGRMGRLDGQWTGNGGQSGRHSPVYRHNGSDDSGRGGQLSRSASTSTLTPTPEIRIDQNQLVELVRQGRVYRKDGFLFLRSQNA